ncbi:MAG: efflux RND transporter permease subunit, partial [candidate division Zixibacteria bacterium]
MNRIARFSVEYPTTVMMLVLATILLGYISFSRLGVDLLPDLNNPRLFVEVTSGELPPEEMEIQYTAPIEAVASRGRKVTAVSSLSRVGRAMITVEYSWDADMDEAFLDLQKAVTDFGENSSADDISVSQHDPNSIPIVSAVFYHQDISDLDQLRRTAENIIRNELIRLPGVAAVEIVGDRKREVRVSTDAFTLEAYGLTFAELAGMIESTNRNMSGGSIVEMGRRYIIRGLGEFESPEDIENLIVSYESPATSGLSPPSGTTGNAGSTENANPSTESATRHPVYLREVADVEMALGDPENIVRFNGRRCIGLEIFKEARFNTIDAATVAVERLASLQNSLPGYDLCVIRDQSRFIS